MIVAGSRTLLRSLAVCVCLLAPAALAAEPPDWSALADVETVSVVTMNEDGSQRHTTVWLAVVEGRGYLRTGNTTWGDNVTRHPEVELVVGDATYAFRVDIVEADDERALVTAAFNEKYGFSDTLIGWFRGARPKIMRLASL